MKIDHIYNQPCGAMEEIPNDTIDCIVTSPPYNLSHKAQRNKKHNIAGYDGFDDRLPQEEYEEQQVRLLDACVRVLKPGGSIFYNHKERMLRGVAIPPHRWVLRSTAELVQTIVWNRVSTHNVDSVRLYPTVEYIFRLRKPGCPPRFNKKCAKWTLVWEVSFAETRHNAHPAPFPVELPARLLAE